MAATSQVTPLETTEAYHSATDSLPSAALQVLYFHAPWAAPCAQMSTVLSALASTFPTTDPLKIAFFSINAEELPEVSEEHDVSAVPYVVLRKEGKTVDTISGTDATKLRTAVEKHVGTGSINGAATLPPAQKVTRPAQPPEPVVHAQDPDSTANTTNGTGASKNLSSYAPSSDDTTTAPQYSSTKTPELSEAPEDDSASKESLHERLTQLVNAAPCMLFMKGTPSAPQCGFSRKLVSMLRENSVRYGFFNILADEEVRQGLKEFADWPTYPQLWMGGELVGGLDIVKEELDADPDFFGKYRVDTSKRNMGGPAAPEAQAGGVAA